MNLSAQFKGYLLSKANPASKATVKNYLSDVNRFIAWFESKFEKPFTPSEVSIELINNFKTESKDKYSASSIERSASSLRKFFTFLKLEGIISHSPFEASANKLNENDIDPWKIRDFKNYLYVLNASPLTMKNYVIDVKQFKAWAEATVPIDGWDITEAKGIVSQIDSRLINDYKNRLLTDLHLSPVSVNRKLSSLRRYTAWAKDEGIIRPSIEVTNEPKLTTPDDLALAMLTAETLPNVEASKEYSKLPPVRVAQKSKAGVGLLLDAALVAPVALALGKMDHALWIAKGKPVFEAAEAATGPLTSILEPMKKADGPIRNVPKSFYAPTHISTANFPLHKKAMHHARYSRPDWYRKYHSYAFVSYLHFSILMIILSLIGYVVFNNVAGTDKQKESVLASVPAAPNRHLSFQGRITSSQGSAIDKKTALRVGIYSSQTASGSALLWQEIITTTPDKDGIFNIMLGKSTPIPSTLFSQNPSLWLGVTVERTQELKPRQPIATVAFASNAETLQGLPPITATSATSNVVLALNSSGNLTIGGRANPTFQATGGTFTLSGNILVLSTNTGSNGNVAISPNGTGVIDLQKGIINSTSNGSPVAGAVNFNDLVVISAGTTGQGVFGINQTSSGDLITASTSGSTRFRVDNGGNVIANGSFNGLSISSGTVTSGTWNGTAISPTYGGTGLNTSASTGVPTISAGTWSVQSVLAANLGGTGLSSYTNGDIIYANGSSSLTVLQIGSNGECLVSNGTTPTWDSCSGTPGDNIFNETFGLIYPDNTDADFAIGGSSTSSAKFAILNVNQARGSQTATLSGSITLDSSNAKIQTTNNQTLAINPDGGNVGIGTSNPGYKFDVSGTTASLTSDSLSRMVFTVNPSANSVSAYDGLSVTSKNQGTSDVGILRGLYFVAQNNSSGTTSDVIGIQGQVDLEGPTSNATGISIAVSGDSGSATNAYGLNVTMSPTASNIYGVYISNSALGGSSTYGIYQTSSGASNYFAGKTGIGTNSPISQLHITKPLSSGATGKALAIFDQIENQDILTASASGTPRFTITSAGGIKLGTSEGSLNNCLLSGGAGSAATWGSCGGSGTSYWQIASGALSPVNNTLDLLVGSQATNSAKFAILNVNGARGTQTASIAGGIVLDSTNAVIQSTQGQNLTLGGPTTGLVQVNNKSNSPFATFDTINNRLGIGTSTPGVALDVVGNIAIPINNYLSFDSGSAFKYIGSDANSITVGSNGSGNFGVANTISGNYWLNVNFTTGLVGLGTSSPTSELHVTRPINFGVTGKALAIFDQIENQDILTASKSGTTMFTLSSTGDITFAGGDITSGTASIDIGEANSGDITTTGDIIPAADNSYTLGSSSSSWNTLFIKGPFNLNGSNGTAGQCLLSGGAGAATWGNCTVGGGTNYWTQTAGALTPYNSTVDLLIGGQSTASAKFAIIGVNGTTPTASISAQNANNSAIYIDPANNAFQNVRKQTLTLGGSTTGNIILSPLNSASGAQVLPGADNLVSLGATMSARYKDLFVGPSSLHVQCSTGDGCGAGGLDYALGVNTSTGSFYIGANGRSGSLNQLLTLTQGGSLGLKTGGTYQINGTDVLSSSSLGSGITSSSLTSLGTLTSLAANGTIDLNTSGSSATNIGTGSYTGTITIGRSTSTDLALNDANWSISGAGAGVLSTLDTGQGANELYDMNQNVQTSDSVSFTNATLTGTGTGLTLSGAATTAINISNTGVTTDINLQNNETISNNTDGLVQITGAIGSDFNFNGSTATFPSTQGFTMGWNFSSGQGEVDLITRQGAGATGGFRVYDWDGATATLISDFRPGGTVSFPLINAGAGVRTVCSTAGGSFTINNGACGTSSLRYKHDIQNLTYGLDEINKIRPVSFIYNDFDPSNPGGRTARRLGFIAEEMSNIIPEVVVYNPDGSPETIDYAFLTSLLVKGIQEQQLQINNVNTDLNNFKSSEGVDLNNSGEIALVPTVDNDFEVRRNTGEKITRVGAFSDLVVARIKAGYLELGRLTVTTADIALATIGELTVNTVRITFAQIGSLTTDALAVSSENITIAGVGIRDYIYSIVDDRITGKQIAISKPIIEADVIKPQEKELTIKLPTNDSSSKVTITNASGSAVTSIDAQGNASIAGKLASNGIETTDATIAGTLRAGKIIANDIELSEDLLAKLEGISIASQSSNVTNNYVANNYYYNSTSNSSSSGYPSFSSGTGTGSATLAGINADYGTFTNGLMAFGPSSFFEVSVADRLFVGGQLSIADRSINVLGADLEIQPLKQGGIAFVGGQVKIDVDGNLKVGGNAVFAKNVEIGGKLSAGIIAPVPGKDLVFQFKDDENDNSAVEFKTGTGSAVLSFNNKGDVKASGSGTFNKLNLSFIPKAIAVNDTEVIATGSAGTADIKPYKNELTIKNPLVTKDSLIYITPKTGTPNQNVYLLRQVPGESFTVGLSKAVGKSVPFNWILIN